MHRQGLALHPKEHERLEALYQLQILETPVEQRFEHVTSLLCKIFDVPVSAISCVDAHRQWFKSIQGLSVTQTDRCISFCQHTILNEDVLIVPDARFDDRFDNNPLVTGDPGIVFYAGTPIYSPEGFPIASLCIIGYEPHSLDERDCAILKNCARLVESMLLTPRANAVEESMIREVGESWRASMIDPLTRRWNAEGMQTLIRETIIESASSKEQIAVTLLKLRGLDHVRTEHGVLAYEQLIHAFSQESLIALPHHDITGRLRGEEFAILHTQVRNEEELHARLRKICDAASSCLHANEHRGANLQAQVVSVIVPPRSDRYAPQIMDRVESLLSTNERDPKAPAIFIETLNDSSPDQFAA